MKLRSIFQLYRSYYPTSSAYRVTITGCGALQMSDNHHKARLDINAAAEFSRLVAGGNSISTAENFSATNLLRDYCIENRRELFMINETRSLYGIVYAENFTADLRLMSLTNRTALPATYNAALRLTWLFALADRATHNRYSLSSVTLERSGNAMLTADSTHGMMFMRITPGAKVYIVSASDNRATVAPDDEISRYARLFCRDNATWFAAFAAGKEARL